MDWINIHTSVLDSVEFMTAEPVDRGTWLLLQRHCCGQENGGRILAAAAWTDRIWLQLVGVTLREVRRASPLWRWDESDLVVGFYNAETEAKVQNNRKVGAKGGHASAAKRRASRRTDTASEPAPHAEPHGSTDHDHMGQPNGQHVGVRKERKGNEREGNEIPPNPQGGTGAGGLNSTRSKRIRASKSGSVLPSEQPLKIRERMTEVGALKRRGADTPWAAREFDAMQEARLLDCSDADFIAQVDVLRAYYHAKIPTEKDYRRRDLQTLLNNWPGELDRARTYQRDHSDGILKP